MIIRPHRDSVCASEDNTLIGNVALYGATSGNQNRTGTGRDPGPLDLEKFRPGTLRTTKGAVRDDGFPSSKSQHSVIRIGP